MKAMAEKRLKCLCWMSLTSTGSQEQVFLLEASQKVIDAEGSMSMPCINNDQMVERGSTNHGKEEQLTF